MGNRLQTMGWEFDTEALCFSCRALAAQRIRVLDRELVTQCTRCGAGSHYACDAEETPPEAVDVGAWRFRHKARCPCCGAEAYSEMVVNPDVAEVVCNKCLFTRLYRFDAFDQGWRR